MEVKLDWQGPFKLDSFLGENSWNQEFKCPGVYVFTVENEAQHQEISYVGRAMGTPNLIQRMSQHHLNMISGRYAIPRHFRENKEMWTAGAKGDLEFQKTILDISKYMELVQEGFKYLNSIKVYLAPLKNNDDNQYDLKHIERNLLWQLEPSGTRWPIFKADGVEFVHSFDMLANDNEGLKGLIKLKILQKTMTDKTS